MNEKELLKALGPLASLYQDEKIREVAVDAYDKILTMRGEAWEPAGVKFDSPDAFLKTIEDLFALKGIDISQKTTAEMTLPDSTRILAVLPPTSIKGPHLVLRKFFLFDLKWDKILEYKSVSQEIIDLIQSAIDARKTILVSGGTSSGKTTVANNVGGLIPEGQRVIAVEDPHEFNIHHPDVLYLEAGGEFSPPFTDLLVAAARMIPDWLVVGELHGPEALPALQLFSTGHAGIATMHANDVDDTLNRLEGMCLMANLGLGLGEIRLTIASAINLILSINRIKLPDGSLRRKVTQVSEVLGIENNRYILQPLFRYNMEEDEFQSTGVKPGWV